MIASAWSVNPPALPLLEAEMDRVYGLPVRGKPHPSYGDRKIPAFEVVKDSVLIMLKLFRRLHVCYRSPRCTSGAR